MCARSGLALKRHQKNQQTAISQCLALATNFRHNGMEGMFENMDLFLDAATAGFAGADPTPEPFAPDGCI
jgi:hypothetical protein